MSDAGDRELIEHFTQALQAIEKHADETLAGGDEAMGPETALDLIGTIASQALQSG